MNSPSYATKKDGKSVCQKEKEASNSDPCDRGTTSGSNLAVIHNIEQSYSRHLSDQKSKGSSTTIHHKATLSRQKKFACEHCNYVTNRKYIIAEHVLIHTGELPFSCDICDYKTREKSNLDVHMRIHTGELPFSCDVCDYKARLKSHLKKHMQIHVGELPYRVIYATI